MARFFADPVWWLYITRLPLYLYKVDGFSLKQIGFAGGGGSKRGRGPGLHRRGTVRVPELDQQCADPAGRLFSGGRGGVRGRAWGDGRGHWSDSFYASYRLRGGSFFLYADVGHSGAAPGAGHGDSVCAWRADIGRLSFAEIEVRS